MVQILDWLISQGLVRRFTADPDLTADLESKVYRKGISYYGITKKGASTLRYLREARELLKLEGMPFSEASYQSVSNTKMDVDIESIDHLDLRKGS